MTNVMQHHIDFKPKPVSHAPSPFGFGFGLSSGPSLGSSSSNMASPSGQWQSSTPGHSNVAAFHQLASSINHSLRPVKRGRSEDDFENEHQRDQSMDRSPTPERPKRAAPKRARMIPSNAPTGQGSSSSSEKKEAGNGQDDDVDVGVLLASLPTQSLLPLLTSLVKAQPELKSTILSLIPKPTLETALQALEQSARKLRDAYPYSNSSTFSSNVSFGFGALQSMPPVHQPQGGMRDSYIVSRLRPHITEFVACCMSYLPYFSSTSTPNQSVAGSHLTHTIQAMHKDKFHPSETFTFLHTITNHILSQPQLTISTMSPLVVPRLMEEWQTWVKRIDEVVNRQAGMFGIETVRGWERGLDEMADSKTTEISTPMRQVRDHWVGKVGWLVGRSLRNAMDEL